MSGKSLSGESGMAATLKQTRFRLNLEYNAPSQNAASMEVFWPGNFSAKALKAPHKPVPINQYHILVGSGQAIKNGAEHRSF